MCPDLTIRRVELFRLDVPLREPIVISLGRMDRVREIVVRLTSADGTAGCGEGCPFPEITGETQESAFVLGQRLAPRLLGRDAWAIGETLADLEKMLPGNSTLHSAFDMALHDLAARRLGIPLHAWFGAGRPAAPCQTDNTVYLNAPGIMAARAAALRDRGFAVIKIKVGPGPRATRERVAAVRQAVGPEAVLVIDANQAWDVPDALESLRLLEPLGVAFCEQPVPHWDHSGLAEVSRAAAIPIMADESLRTAHDAVDLIRRRACSLFNVKLAKAGGLAEARRILAVAAAAGIPCQIGAMVETRFALTAAVHLAAAHPIIRFLDLDTFEHHAEDPVDGGVSVDPAGFLTLPAGPGIGASFRPDALAASPSVSVE